jgi:Bacterial pre-peptidase C-terminal domain
MKTAMTRIFSAIALLFIAATARAGDPQINSLSPYGVQRGTEATLTVSGSGLATVKELLFYTPGFTVKSIEAAKDDALKVLVAVAPDCQLGIHAVRLRSLGGVSNLRTFAVGNMAEVAEVEPNTAFDQAQAIPLNVTVSGVVQSEDIDHFGVELKKGDRLNVELEGLRLGSNTFFDPTLSIRSADGIELAKSDDAPLVSQDCLASLIAPQDGKYIIQLREVAFGGSAAATYRLHVGTFPRPTAIYPPGGKPGETLNVRWIGDAAGEFSQQITLPVDGKSEAAIVARDVHHEAPSPNVLRVSDLAWTNEQEPNDDIKTATLSATTVPLAMHGIVEKPGDVDFHKFMAKKGQQLDVKVYARKPLRSPLDAVLMVHNDKGATIANNDDTGGPDSFARLTIPADGDYFVSIRDQLKRGGADCVYRVEITETKPTLVIRLPERRQYISTTLVIPQNNRNAVMIAAQRQNFAGELAVSFENLPPGVTAEAIPMAAGMQEIPVVFTAAADAPPAGALVGISGKTTDPKQNVVGYLDQRTMLVRGQNNTDVWGHNADRMATVVAEAIPYSLDLIAPKAPLVRNGSVNLKVIAKRAEGFKDPISLRLLYNPPGVASSGFITIPEGQNEGTIPLTANNGAGLGTWKVCVTGRSGGQGRRGGGGGAFGPDDSLRCTTQFADLKIEDQHHKLSFVKTAVEQGKETNVVVKIQKLRDFEGTATAELAGLPANTSAQSLKFTKDTTELTFKVAATKDARPNRYTSLVCVTKFELDGDTVTHTIGGGELRIDTPLPAKK